MTNNRKFKTSSKRFSVKVIVCIVFLLSLFRDELTVSASDQQDWDAIFGALSRHDDVVMHQNAGAISWEQMDKLAMEDDARLGDFYWIENIRHFRDSYVMYSSVCTHRLTITYIYNKQEADAFERKLRSVVRKMHLDGKSDAQKAEAIYRYIINHVEYDYEALSAEERQISHTAYGALMNGKAVCQGYSLLYLRMAYEAGLEAKYISGTSDYGTGGGGHAWNIVKIGKRYYNVDVCWDDNGFYDADENRYFLLNDKDFKHHTRDALYASQEFTSKYRMAKRSYHHK